jgi:predicted secreted protein
MGRKAGWAATLAVTGSLVLVAAGCGGGGEKSSAEAPSATTTETHAGTTVESRVTVTQSTEVTSFASAGNCKELAELGQRFASAVGASGVTSDTKATAKFLSEFADKTPKEIRSDFQLLATTYAKIVKALGEVKTKPGQPPSAEALAKLQKVTSEIDQAALTKAETHITTWVTTNCKG